MMTDQPRARILFLRSATGVFGAEQVILQLAVALDKHEFEPIVGVIANGHPDSTKLYDTAKTLGLATKLFPSTVAFDWRTSHELREFIKSKGIEFLNPHGYKANFYAYLAARGTQAKCVATCHPWTETRYSLRARIYTMLDAWLLAKMDEIVAVSTNVQEQVQRRLSGRECRVIPNGVDLRQYGDDSSRGEVRESLDLPAESPVIGTIGRLVPEKAYDVFIDSLSEITKRHPRVTVLVVGDGPLRPALEAQVRERALDNNVRFLGVRRDIPALLSAMDVFVLPSISEGLPMAILEAMAAGKSIVATSVGDVPKLVKDNETGLLVRPGDSIALASAIDFLLSEEERAAELRANAKILVQDSFSSHAMAKQYEERFRALRLCKVSTERIGFGWTA